MTNRVPDPHPRLKANWQVAFDGDERAFFVSEARSFYLDGTNFQLLVPLLDGRHSDAEIASALRDTMSMSDTARALARLRGLDVIADGDAGDDLAALAYFDSLGIDPTLARSRLNGAVVAIAAEDAAVASELARLLAEVGVKSEHIAPSGSLDGVALVVGVYSDYLDDRLLALNQGAVTAGVPLLCTVALGTTPWVGPLVVPGVAACVACLAQRLRAARQIDAYLRARDVDALLRRVTAGLATTVAIARSFVANEVVLALVAAERSNLVDQLVTFDTTSFALERHPVVRLPQCEVCGDPTIATSSGEAIELQPRPTIGGSHRVATAEATLQRLNHQIDPITGAVSRLIPLDLGFEGLTYSYAAAHSFAVLGKRFDNLLKAMRGSLSGGKGRTDIAARTGALCEALERFVGVFRGDERRIRAAYGALGEEAIAPGELSHFSETQYEARTDGVPKSRYSYVPERFDPNRPIDWTPAWSLTGERRVLVPSAYCYYGHPDLLEHEYCLSDSNGQAAGGCLEEAVLQGLYEIVERDAVALWWFNRLRRPAVDLDSLGDRYVDDLRGYYRSLGRDLWVLDLTADTGIPVYAACSPRLDHPVEDIIVGFGAHLDPVAALERAIDECNQFLPAVIRRTANGETAYWSGADPEALEWWQHATLASEPYLVAADGPTRPLPASGASDDLADDVAGAMERLTSVGLDLVVVDLTRPDVELSVAKVIVPSMRHFWRQVGSGRLYDVPVELGWLDRPFAEAELNPRTIFF